MNKSINLALLQANLAWEKPNENFNNFEKLLKTLKNKPDIIVLPEMFSTGFSMDSNRLAEKEKTSQSLKWMKSISQEYNSLIIGSLIIHEKENYFNRLYAVFPTGKFKKYDKKHLFRMANEHHHFSAGKNKLVIEYLSWKICPLICYDLRFPVFSRNRYLNNHYQYDLLIYVANWPKARANAWSDLLKARAHENLCYTAGLNRVGIDGNGIEYSGDSAIIDFKGNTLTSNTNEKAIEYAIIKSELDQYRTKFPAGMDSDSFTLNA